MALLSKFLADWRFSIVQPYIKGSVLDIGCGQGRIFEQYHLLMHRYYGVEFHPQHVEKLSIRFPDAFFVAHNLDEKPIHINEQFDTILILAVVEHIWNQKTFFEGMVNHLKPTGRMVITTPTPFGNDCIHAAGSRVGLFAQSASIDHIVIYNKNRFQILADEFNLHILKYKRFQCFCNQMVVLTKNCIQADAT